MMSVYGTEGRYKAKQSTTRRNCGKKQKKKKYCPQQACKLSILPDEIVMNCLAFVPRLDHGSLYLVSKLHRSLMLSPELYQARSLMGRTEHCIYLSSCSIFRGGPWLGYICDWWDDWREAVVQVFFLDCRSHTWTNLPSMMLARACAAVGVVDGKIYVVGGVKEPNPRKWVVETMSSTLV
uniref:F-box domain-containing protein n=1 Tax=Brassica campestris TaxID=3711 RepID=A0A3P6C402_BRACM|nr:unnamed protein product [Brassica rapa]